MYKPFVLRRACRRNVEPLYTGLSWPKLGFALKGLFTVLLLLVAAGANAKVVTLDFNDGPGGVGLTTPYLEDGFRIQVLNCHYDIEAFPGTGDGTQWMGFDGDSSCHPMVSTPRLRLDRFGLPFHLLSLEVVSSRPGLFLESSRGGSELACVGGLPTFGCSGIMRFAAPAWRNIAWVDFVSTDDIGAPLGAAFDNIRLAAVPAPGTLALLLGGLMGIGMVVCRRRLADTPFPWGTRA